MNHTDKPHRRKGLPLIILFSLLALAAAFVLLLPVIRETFPSKTSEKYTKTPTYQTVAQRDSATLQSVTVTHQNGDTYTLVYQDGALALQTDAGEPESINAMFSQDILKYATGIYVEDTVTTDQEEVREHLPDMGLDPPQIWVTALYADGSADTLSFGYNMPDSPYYYYQWSGDDAVYLCNPGVYETFEYTADMLLSVAQPPILRSLIERVSISGVSDAPIVCAFFARRRGFRDRVAAKPRGLPHGCGSGRRPAWPPWKTSRLGARLGPVTDETRAQYGLAAPRAVVKIAQREGLYSEIDSQGALKSMPLDLVRNHPDHRSARTASFFPIASITAFVTAYPRF